MVFDPANVVVEDDEANNRGIYSLNVSSPEPVRKLSGTITLDPPAAEPGAEIGVSIFIKNIGNVPLDNFTLQYAVSGGAGTGFTGSATIVTLPKNDIAIVQLGKFKPASTGEYTVVVTPSDSSITLIAGPKAIKVSPFAAANMTATPSTVPVSLPLVQAHTKISRGNTIIVPDDPLVPLLKTHIQRGLNWQAQYINADLNADFCFRCHVTAQGMVSFEESRKVSGVTVNEVVEERMLPLDREQPVGERPVALQRYAPLHHRRRRLGALVLARQRAREAVSHPLARWHGRAAEHERLQPARGNATTATSRTAAARRTR